MKRLLLSTLLLTYYAVGVHAQPEGEWYTILNAMGTKLPLQISLSNGDAGWSGELVSPTQSKRAVPMSSVTFDGQKVSFGIQAIGAKFDGVLDGKELRGVFNQATMDFPLTFTRHRPEGFPIDDGPVTIKARPQDPTDFPYQREQVTFPGGADDVQLAGELTLPEDDEARAVIVLISGSGPQNRNQYLGTQINHSPFLVLSDYLTRRGYGVLRYDDRGVAESTGDFSTATSADFAEDAWAAVRYLRTREELKNTPIGLAGHSEGGMIAPMVAAADGELDFVILMAAPAVPIDSLMLEQRRRVAAASGLPEMAIKRDEPALRAAYTWIKENTSLSQEDYVEGLYEVFAGQMDHLPKPLRESITDKRAFNKQYVDGLRSPWMRYFIAFDPREYLEQLTVPTLAINGINDTQVPGMENLNAISEALAQAGNEDLTVVPLLGLNHLFQPSETGAPSEYGTIETTIDPQALEAIGTWLGERF